MSTHVSSYVHAVQTNHKKWEEETKFHYHPSKIMGWVPFNSEIFFNFFNIIF